LLRKQLKSRTLITGGEVEPSQLAAAFPSGDQPEKHEKSRTFNRGGVVEPSQLA